MTTETWKTNTKPIKQLLVEVNDKLDSIKAEQIDKDVIISNLQATVKQQSDQIDSLVNAYI